MVDRGVVWIGSSKHDLKSFPPDVQDEMGYALWLGQTGSKHPDTKPLHGFGGAGVLEVTANHDGATFRMIYTLTLPDAVYVLHAFQKKSKRGSATTKRHLDLVQQRLAWARALHQRRNEGRAGDLR